MRVCAVAIGGAAGAVCRYLVAGWVQSLTLSFFPLGTLVVNASGCFAFGLLATTLMGPTAVPEAYKLLLLVGFCGGYTTFSSFAWESIALIDGGRTALALANVALSNVLCLAGVWLGHRLTSP